jgi:hypothetical protein
MAKKRPPYHLDVNSKFSWCRAGWIFLNSVALMFPKTPGEDDYDHYDKFFSNVGWVLPCSICRDHYNKYLSLHPLPHGQGGRELSQWLNDLRNEINREHSRPEVPWAQMLASYMPLAQAVNMFGLSDQEQESMRTAPKMPDDISERWILPCILSLLVLLIVLALLCFLKLVCKRKLS